MTDEESENIGCEYCDEGNLYYYFANHAHKKVKTDFSYCTHCYPGSNCNVGFGRDGVEITSEEFERLLQNGYTEDES